MSEKKKRGTIPVIHCSNLFLVGCAGEANLVMVIWKNKRNSDDYFLRKDL